MCLSFGKSAQVKLCNVTSWKGECAWETEVNVLEATVYSFKLPVLNYMVLSHLLIKCLTNHMVPCVLFTVITAVSSSFSIMFLKQHQQQNPAFVYLCAYVIHKSSAGQEKYFVVFHL